MEGGKLALAFGVLALASGCGSSSAVPTSGTDAAQDAPGEAGTEPHEDATVSPPEEAGLHPEAGDSGSRDAGATPEAAPDAPADAQKPRVASSLLFVGVRNVTLTGGVLSGTTVAATFSGGAWSTVTPLASDSNAFAGGGGAVLGDGRDLAVVVSAPDAGGAQVDTSLGTGTLPALTARGKAGVGLLGGPIATATGALAVTQSSSGAATLATDELTASTSAWTLDTSTAFTGETHTIPALALTKSGDPLLLFATASSTYGWSVRTAGTWSAAQTVPGVAAAPYNGSFPGPGIVAVRAYGSGDVVAVFVAPTPSNGPVLQSAVFSAGAWSAALPAASDIALNTTEAGLALAALPDGRVALGYSTGSNTIKIGFWNGSAWGAFQTVPRANASFGPRTLAIAPGTAGAILELVYVINISTAAHVRLTDEASWTWSSPDYPDPGPSYSMVSLAAAGL